VLPAQDALDPIVQKTVILKTKVILHKQRCSTFKFKCDTVSYCNLSFYSVLIEIKPNLLPYKFELVIKVVVGWYLV